MRRCIALAALLLAGLLPFVCPEAVGQDESADNQTADQAAIEKAAVRFVEAYNEHDAKALAALFADDAEMVERDGGRFAGHDEIEYAFANAFAQSPHAKISLTVDSVRFVTPDVAVEEGASVWFPDGETATMESTYRVAHVKRDGKWLMAGVRTIDDRILTPYEYLRDLEWMVGDWVDEGDDAVVVTNVRWDANRAFLLREFSVKVGGQAMLKGTQRIGWDSRKDQFRSWTFDSEGGYVEGIWTRVGDGYVIRSSGFLRDGIAVSGTSRVDRQGNDRFSWAMFNRLRGDEIMPDVNLTIVRKPPLPAGEDN